MPKAAKDHPLRRWRETQKLTLRQLGEKLGVPATTVCNYELGRRIPRRDTMGLILQLTAGAVTADDFYREAAE